MSFHLQGAVATLHGNKLVCLNSAAGSPKLDLAMSLDIQATAVSKLLQCGVVLQLACEVLVSCLQIVVLQ